MTNKALYKWGPFIFLIAVIIFYVGYVKDDAFISFRYAANWAQGNGLVFNVGDKTEGYTNFLWTAAIAGLIYIGLPPLLGAKILCAITAFLGLLWVRKLAVAIAPDCKAASDRAAWLYAASPTIGLWAGSAMEPTCFAAICAGAALLSFKANQTRTWKHAAFAGLAISACALLRPEGHLLVLIFALIAPRAIPFALLILVPYHLIRFSYFGDWFPNTFYVKANAASFVSSLKYVGLFLLFYGHGILLVLAFWAAKGKNLQTKLLASIPVAFVFYLVYVGWDEMRWFRLYAPALPFLFALASQKIPSKAVILFVIFGVITHITAWPLHNYIKQGHRSYMQLANTILERAKPGDAALFQDAGATPFYAMKVPFFEPIGVVDHKIAQIYHNANWSPFRGCGNVKLERKLRDELLSRTPRFIALVAYIPSDSKKIVHERFKIDPEETLRPFFKDNCYSHGIPTDKRFISDYALVKAWRRNDSYYLVLYERK